MDVARSWTGSTCPGVGQYLTAGEKKKINLKKKNNAGANFSDKMDNGQ